MALVIGNKKKKITYGDGVQGQHTVPSDKMPIQHTLDPIVTGSSVIALRFDGGVVIATDTLQSYGSSAKFRDIQRIQAISKNALIASTGEYSDFQEVLDLLLAQEKQQFLHDDNIHLTPRNYGHYLARLSYAKRNKFNPYLLHSVIVGYDEKNGGAYIANVDSVGTYLENDYALTGFALQMCQPIIQNYWNPQRDLPSTREVIIKCLQNLVYRDARTSDKVQFAIIDKNGIRIEEPFRLQTKWDYAGYKNRANELLHTQ